MNKMLFLRLVVTATCCFSLCANAIVYDDKKLEQIVLSEISSTTLNHKNQNLNVNVNVPHKIAADVNSAIHDTAKDEEKGRAAWNFLFGLASSKTFVKRYWQKKPLLIRAKNTGGWLKNFFTVEEDLRLIDNSYITGFKTAEILRNGTKTDSWALSPIKENPSRKTTWSDVVESLENGTIYFNTAGSLWPNLGGLCRLTAFAFGLPPNVNVYVTPPGCKLSVPSHTDQQNVLVFQTQGCKHWQVFAPPPRSNGKDPLNRGKSGDVLSFEEMGPPLIDAVLRPGDCLYIPVGFPHTTDTSIPVDGADDGVFQEPSLHLTMGLDTHVWCLTLAHLRWTLLQRCGMKFDLQVKDDDGYWKSMESMPIGFLGGGTWKECVRSLSEGRGVNDEFKREVASRLKKVLIELEPERWTVSSSLSAEGTEDLPSDSEIDEVTEYMVASHWRSLMANQEEQFKGVDPSSEESMVKAFRGTQEQNLILERYGGFSKNKAFEQAFAQRRRLAEERTKGAFS